MNECSHGKTVWDWCEACWEESATGHESELDRWVEDARRCQRQRSVECRSGGRCGGHQGSCWGPRPEGV